MFCFVDTAGIRRSPDSSIENLGIRQSIACINDADIVCVVLDASARIYSDVSTQSPGDFEMLLNQIRQNQSRAVPVCVLWNKSDLVNNPTAAMSTVGEDASFGGVMDSAPRFSVSAETGFGLPDLMKWMVRAVVPTEPDSKTVLPLR